ncbi:hypothetical protein AURDEDRAFT_165932 [Auricularia subglabra TFB-10046 SS5]|nr:hypothetical protein AURDEDRAFT_165932 [Auricularia subglabra TFB-10046 SS5]
MPDETGPRDAGDGEPSRFNKDSPDLPGEEMADNAYIWHEYNRVAGEEDRDRIAHWNHGLDNLALFAGLFS